MPAPKSQQLELRANRDYTLLTSAGLVTGETFYPPGTAVDTSAVRRARLGFEELPPASEALDALADRVLAEDRQDSRALFGNVWVAAVASDARCLLPSPVAGFSLGQRAGVSDIRLAPTDNAMRQILARCPDPGVTPPADVCAWMPNLPATEVVCRTRKLPQARGSAYWGCRELFAVVSPKYVAYDLDAAAHDLATIAPEGSRARIRYDGGRARVDLVLQNPYRLDGEDAAGVGETHRVILRMRTADDGSSGYHLSLLAERVRCTNLTLLHASRALLSASHRRTGLRDMANQALEAIEPTLAKFAAVWAEAWRELYADRYTGPLSGEEALRRIVAAGKYRIAGLGAAGTEAACLSALAEEPGDTKAHVHNALTRAAHNSGTSWQTRWADDEAEEQASKLLYQQVRWLAAPEETHT